MVAQNKALSMLGILTNVQDKPVSGAIRTSFIDTHDLNLNPIDLFIEESALVTLLRLTNIG